MGEKKIILHAENIRMEFGGLLALKDVNIDIYDGELISLIGPNGAGKTTFLNIVSGIYKPVRGRIIFEGEEITGNPPDEIAYRRITRTFQTPQLFTNMTVIENIMVGYHTKIKRGMLGCIFTFPWTRSEEKWIRERSAEFLEFIGLADKAHRSVTALPYGDRKKLELARALALEPKLLLLDEPTAGLNMDEKESIIKLISLMRDKGLTILIIEHDMNVVMKISERVIVLNYGEKIFEGKPEDAGKDPMVISAYLGEES